MKWLKLLTSGILGIILIIGCDVNKSIDDSEQNTGDPVIEQKSEFFGGDYQGKRYWNQKYKVIPFKGSFFTTPAGPPVPNERCADPALLQTQVGEGHAKGIGKFTFRSAFCIDLTDVLPPPASNQELIEGEALPFYGEVTTFTFNNNDELYASGGSAVMPSNNPDYNAEFSNSFAILGGTGRFEGAMGGGTSNSLVVFQTGTDHNFSGVIVIPRNHGNKHWREDK